MKLENFERATEIREALKRIASAISTTESRLKEWQIAMPRGGVETFRYDTQLVLTLPGRLREGMTRDDLKIVEGIVTLPLSTDEVRELLKRQIVQWEAEIVALKAEFDAL